MRKLITIFLLIGAIGAGAFFYFKDRRPPVETKFIPVLRQDFEGQAVSQISLDIVEPGASALIENNYHEYQTFNNCGPTTLAMILNWHGANTTQKDLGAKMRPWQNPQGDNDDKTIFTYEFVDWAKTFGFEAISRPNGDIELLKRLTANGIPVVVKTWLNVNDDIGHFRVVRGFDEEKQIIIQDDSYHGPNKRIPYFDFLSMWQPFNYDYMIVYTKEIAPKIEAILGEEVSEAASWRNALSRAEKEAALDPDNFYPVFNLAVAAYYTGDYEKSVAEFEKIESRLPRRMLWYQIEPIKAYQSLKNYDRVFEMANRIIENGNRAFSELYLIRGEIYLAQGDRDAARTEFELAVKYNQNLQAAKDALDSVR